MLPTRSTLGVLADTALTLAACGSDDGTTEQPSDAPIVVATTSIWADITANVACDGLATVQSVIPPGGDPHSFEPSIRDRETMEIALTAAETGHIVFSTLHTISASQSIARVIGMFTNEEGEQIRQRLGDTLRYVISQRLAPKVGGGRVLVSEIMGSNLRTREAILLGENDIRNFHEIIESNYQNGWHSFEQSLIRLFKENRINEETAMLYSVNKPAMRKAIDIAKKSMMGEDKTPSGFRLNLEALHVAPGTTPPPLPQAAG